MHTTHLTASILKTLALFMLMHIMQSCGEAGVDITGTITQGQTIAPAQNASMVNTEFALIDGRKIAYRSIGSGDPVILCQRFRGNLDDWDPAFLNALAKTYRVIIFNYSGFASSTGNPSTDMQGFAKDVLDLTKALEIEKFTILGWSFGGFVAQHFAMGHPDRIDKMILIGTKPPGKVSFPPEQIFFERALKPVNDLEDNTILFFEPASEISTRASALSLERIGKRTTDKETAVLEEHWQYYFKGGDDFGADSYDTRTKLMQTTIPILVITGDHEICFPAGNWFELNRQLPTTQLIVIPQAGHGPQHQYPELIAEYITSFVEILSLQSSVFSPQSSVN